MQKRGLVLPHFEEALSLLQRLNEQANSAKEALVDFLSIVNGDLGLLEWALQEVYESDLGDLSLHALGGAATLLKNLHPLHTLAVVTTGKPSIQMQKLKRSGIDSSLFSKILVTEKGDKGPLYKELLEEFSLPAKRGLVCGDRIWRDLSPAKQLGMRTALILWGRGLNAPLPSPDVDFVLSSLSEVEKIVHDLKGEE